MAFSPTFQRPFSATFDRRAAAAGNGLLNALIAYWPGDEASGNLQDAHTNALHLTDTNTVTNAAGKVYATARQYTRTNQEYHARAGDDALLSTGDVDFSIATWVLLDSKPGMWNSILGKAANVFGTNAQREYFLQLDPGTDRFRWYASDGTNLSDLLANSFGAPSLATWYLVVVAHDSVSNTITIQINNGTVDSAAHSGGVLDGAGRFTIGRIIGGNPFDWNGRIGPTAFWKSAAGGGGVLSAAQRTALYNGGAGLAYAQFTT